VRPAFAVQPGPGQVSVWDFPRPPRLDADSREVVIRAGEREVARTRRAVLVLETAHPPSWYLPAGDWLPGSLRPGQGSSTCEWKGRAAYLDVVAGGLVASVAAWTYPDPTPRFAALVDHVAVYPAAMDRCTVDGELVRPQEGGFYGGWITAHVAGPVKGPPGSHTW